ncbi:MAG: hypothetical protein J7L96_06990 [Bacteroidales bacterium]|nr:hypothetical protein [Bacteroidales bacterium]
MRENKELFMEKEPAIGHFQRFEKKLNSQNNRKKALRITIRVSRVAAIGLLVIMSSLWAYNEFIAPDRSIPLSKVNSQYQDVEFYFTNQINSKYDELQHSQLLNDPKYKKLLKIELNQMDSTYNQLKIELGANPDDERIINAMVRHYQIKLRVLSDILDRFNSLQQKNDTQIKNQKQYESVKL